jgi:hypothetical protein
MNDDRNQGFMGSQENQSHTEEKKKSTSTKGLEEGWTRATFIMREEYVQKLKAYAYWERKTVKDVVDHMLEQFLKGKSVKDLPE